MRGCRRFGGLAAALSCFAAVPATAEVTVTRISGDAVRRSNAPVPPPTMRRTCGLLNLASLCLARNIRITMAPQASGTIASVTRFRIGAVTGTSFVAGGQRMRAR
ncbi:hypothetical protein GCM10009075_36630 [Sphingomonas trueperi]